MELIIKNERIEKIIELGKMTYEDIKSYHSSHTTPEDHLKMILGGYLVEMLDTAEKCNLELDLGYNTVRNIAGTIVALATIQKEHGYDDERNKQVVMKTLAGYLSILAMNNHNMSFSAKQFSNRHNENRPEYWADMFELRLNNKKNSDLLPACMEAVSNAQIEVENGFVIDANPIIEKYLALTGENLAEYGLANIIIQL